MGTRQINLAIARNQKPPEPADAMVEPARVAGSKRRTRHAWAPRLAVLGCLAAATVVVPLVGVSSPGDMAASASTTLSTTSGLDVLAAGSSYGTDTVDMNNLGADPTASMRAVVSASRDHQRTAPVCGNLAAEANGSAAAEVASAPVGVVMPLPQGAFRTTSNYGHRSLWGHYSMHAGVDFAASAGTPIHVIADGVVEYVGPGKHGRSGTLVIVRHDIDGHTVWSWYIHMYPNGVYVQPGDDLHAGDTIAEVGSYGNSTGPHLHLEIHVDKELATVDPAPWLAQHDAMPLTNANLECFQE